MCSSTRSTPGGGSAAAAMVAVMVAAQGPQVPNGWLSCSHRGNGADAAAPSIVTMALLPLASISWSAASSTPHQSGTNGRQQEAGAQLLFTLAAQQWQPNERQHQGSSPGHSWNPIAVLARSRVQAAFADTDDDGGGGLPGRAGGGRAAGGRGAAGPGPGGPAGIVLDLGSETEGPSEELQESTEEELGRLPCGICRRPLVPRRGEASEARRQRIISSLKICDGCHHCFHATCCRRKHRGAKVRGLGGEGEDESLWFCSPGCQAQHAALSRRCQAGAQQLAVALSPPARQWPLPADAGVRAPKPQEGLATWQLARAGARQDEVQYQAVTDAIKVLAPEYGPFVVRQMEGSDYVAVLRRGGRPVSAVVMDCFGQQGCCVDLLSTLPEARNQGHARALVQSLERVLRGEAATARLLALVANDSAGSANSVVAGGAAAGLSAAQGGASSSDAARGLVQEMWQRGLGYSKLSNREVHALQDDIPALGVHGRGAITVLSKRLASPQQLSAVVKALTLDPEDHAAAAAVAAAPSKAQQQGAAAGRVKEGARGKGGEGEEEGRRVRKPTRSYWQLRLWGWALRKALYTTTFGLVG